ncbi:MAG: MFS transporter [Xanthomonadales bacterium]
MRLALTLSGVIALRMLGLFMILPVFMILAKDLPGFTPLTGGLAIGIYGLTQAALQQPFGWLSDRWGRRPVLLMGLFLFAAGGVLAALAESMPWLIAGRAVQGCGAIAGVAMAFAADFTRPHRRSISMAIIGIGIGGAFLLSMMLSVPLAMVLGLEGLFWLTVIFALVGVLLVFTLPRNLRAVSEPGSEVKIDMKPVWLLALSVFLLHAAMTLLFVVLPPLLVGTYELALAEHWKIYVPTMLVSVLIIFPLLRKVGKNLTEHRLMPWAFFALAASMAAMGLLDTDFGLLGLAVLMAVYFLGFNLLEASMPALLARVSGSRGRGRRMGVYSTFQFLGAFAGGLSGGWLLGVFGSGIALLVAAGTCVVWGVLLKVALSRRILHPSPQVLNKATDV